VPRIACAARRSCRRCAKPGTATAAGATGRALDDAALAAFVADLAERR